MSQQKVIRRLIKEAEAEQFIACVASDLKMRNITLVNIRFEEQKPVFGLECDVCEMTWTAPMQNYAKILCPDGCSGNPRD